MNLSVGSDNVEPLITSGTSSSTFELVITDLSTTHIYSFSVAAGGQVGHGEFSEYSDDAEVGKSQKNFVCVIALCCVCMFV